MKARHVKFVVSGLMLIIMVMAGGFSGCSSALYQGKENGEMQEVDSKVVTFTDEQFAAEIGSGVALVDFWAEWCGPCRMQGPIVESVAAAMDGKATVGKLNVDEHQNTAVKFGIRSIPTLIIFKDGEEVERLIGVQQEQTLIDKLNAHTV